MTAVIGWAGIPCWEQDREKNYRLYQWYVGSFVSVKTVLFVFYFLILIVAQVINIAPTLAGEKLSNFVLANNCGIVLLIAFDRIAAQFSKDGIDPPGIQSRVI